MRIEPVGLFAGEDVDGSWRYGLVFRLPEAHGFRPGTSFESTEAGGWELVAFAQPDRHALIIPRCWLITRGFLPALAALRSKQAYPLRGGSRLLAGFWVEREEVPAAA